MDLDSVLGLPRWKILELLAGRPLSPVEISVKLGTSVSYVSQQLKLLEVGGFVRKERTGAAEKGKPRSVYSIRKEIAHVMSVFAGGSVNKEIILDNHHKTILRIWGVENSFFHYHLEKLYWKLEEHIDEISGIFYKESGNKIDVIVVSDSSKVKNLIGSLSGKFSAIFKIVQISTKAFAEKDYKDFSAIYFPENSGSKKMKGGKL